VPRAPQGVNVTALREIKLLQELKHPNIIRLIDVFPHKRNLNLVRRARGVRSGHLGGKTTHMCCARACTRTCPRRAAASAARRDVPAPRPRARHARAAPQLVQLRPTPSVALKQHTPSFCAHP
jgi:hypothetical protein